VCVCRRRGKTLVKSILEVFVHRNVPPFLMRYGPVTAASAMAAGTPFEPFDGPASHQRLLQIVIAILLAIPEDAITSQAEDIAEFTEHLLAIAEKPSTPVYVSCESRVCARSETH
jgi:hypothetical protein